VGVVKRYPMEYGGKRMSWAKAAVARGLVFLSGVEGRDMETDEAPPTMRAQAANCMAKIKERLEELDSSLENIVILTIYVTDLDEYFRERVDRHIVYGFLEEHCPSFKDVPPAETLLQVAGLARRGMKIEIDVVAATNDPD
jgi:enamine deaminase RidA (YjgF/YER057c/UK114 family)